jgi:hypothetical protein
VIDGVSRYPVAGMYQPQQLNGASEGWFFIFLNCRQQRADSKHVALSFDQ